MPKKILLVDESSTALMVQKLILGRNTDYQLIIATNGKEAVESARREIPDLILMSAVMPVMTGIEACRELRNRAETAQIPVVLVTAQGDQECIEAGFKNGCNDYITKPIHAEELLVLVTSYLEGQ